MNGLKFSVFMLIYTLQITGSPTLTLRSSRQEAYTKAIGKVCSFLFKGPPRATAHAYK